MMVDPQARWFFTEIMTAEFSKKINEKIKSRETWEKSKGKKHKNLPNFLEDG